MTNSSNETRQACFTAMKPWLGYCLWFCALILGQPVWAGGSGLNTIVVINQNSTNSLQLGNDYCELRGVPPQNVLRVTGWTGGSISWTPTQFTNYLLNPLLTLAASRGLTNQAQFVLLSMDIPYRVTDGSNVNSTTAALYYGFKTNGAPVIGISSCSLPDASFNSYVYSELPFSQASPDTASTNAFLAMKIGFANEIANICEHVGAEAPEVMTGIGLDSRIGIGYMLDEAFLDERYWIEDPGTYHLPPVWGTYRWVRYYNDCLLIDIDTGQTVEVLYNVFW